MVSELVGKGLPLYLPNGYTLWRTLQNYITDKEINMDIYMFILQIWKCRII